MRDFKNLCKVFSPFFEPGANYPFIPFNNKMNYIFCFLISNCYSFGIRINAVFHFYFESFIHLKPTVEFLSKPGETSNSICWWLAGCGPPCTYHQLEVGL